jgi:hypothetical protein
MSTLSPADERRLISSAALLQSDKDGEVVSAARAVGRILQKGNLDLPALIRRGLNPSPVAGHPALRGFPDAPRPSPQPYDVSARHQTTARMCQAFAGLLNDWEREFLASIAHQRRISDKQRDRLKAIEAKIERRRPK